jgi:hypothetical protein
MDCDDRRLFQPEERLPGTGRFLMQGGQNPEGKGKREKGMRKSAFKFSLFYAQGDPSNKGTAWL